MSSIHKFLELRHVLFVVREQYQAVDIVPLKIPLFARTPENIESNCETYGRVSLCMIPEVMAFTDEYSDNGASFGPFTVYSTSGET